MKRKREMRTMTVGEMEEFAKKHESEDSQKGGDGENIHEPGTK
jgi:hypothetical protein